MDEQLQLRDIHLPEPVSWWPPAPGWWLLAVLLLVFAALMIWQLRRFIRRGRPRRSALRRLQQIRTMQGQPAIQSLNQLLKQVAMRKDPSTAQYNGRQWTQYLEPDWPAADTALLELLSDQPYRRHVALDDQDKARLIEAAGQWIRRQL